MLATKMNEAMVDVSTELGDFRIFIDCFNTPLAAEYFLAHVDAKLLESTTVYRIVKKRPEGIDAKCPIEVVQWGMKPDDPSPLAPVKLETTNTSKLRHRQWSISTARFAADELYGGFFICMRDEPSLNHGGQRHPDGMGFATFGHVQSGFETLHRIFSRAEESNFLQKEIGIERVSRL